MAKVRVSVTPLLARRRDRIASPPSVLYDSGARFLFMAEDSRSPMTADRVAAWNRDDPEELRRAAEEWRRLGHSEYADFLEAWARGESPPYVQRPMP